MLLSHQLDAAFIMIYALHLIAAKLTSEDDSKWSITAPSNSPLSTFPGNRLTERTYDLKHDNHRINPSTEV